MVYCQILLRYRVIVLKALYGKILLKNCSNSHSVPNNKFTEIRNRWQMGGCFEFDDDDDENAYHYDEYDDDDENDNNLY